MYIYLWDEYFRGHQGRIPVHTALTSGTIEWSFELLSIIRANQNHLDDVVDPVTKWPLFGLAAAENS